MALRDNIRWVPVVYALSIPAVLVSGLLISAGKPWWEWLGGCLYLVWGVFGYTVEYIKKIKWRSPIYWPIFVPYLILYLATCMFYWWPLAHINKPFWYVAVVLFIIATDLNVSSHQRNTT
jgi:hypothetical protein